MASGSALGDAARLGGGLAAFDRPLPCPNATDARNLHALWAAAAAAGAARVVAIGPGGLTPSGCRARGGWEVTVAEVSPGSRSCAGSLRRTPGGAAP